MDMWGQLPMLLDRTKTSVPLGLEIVVIVGHAPPQESFEIFNKKKHFLVLW